jgi:hypothetical protein
LWRPEGATKRGLRIATIHHQTEHFDLGSAGLGPGQSIWLSWGPNDMFTDGTVIVKANPATDVLGPAGTTLQGTNVLSVGPIFTTSVHVPLGGGLSSAESHVGANITNAGQNAIRYFAVSLTVIRA